MVVRLRLAVHGPRNDRIFHLVAINGRKRRNAKPIETLGMFKARSPSGGSKCVEWNPAHIKRWLDNGAQPSERVVRLLELGQVIPQNSKWHPNNRRTPKLNILKAEEHISTTSQRAPGARIHVLPPSPKSSQSQMQHIISVKESRQSPEEEMTDIVERLLKI